MNIANGAPSQRTTSAVVLNFNDARSTVACIRSLLASREALDSIIVVDNGSGKTDLAILDMFVQGAGSGVALLVSPANSGFGAGMNLGIQRALSDGADSVLLLNNDTLVRPGAIEAMVRALESDATVGVVVPIVTTGSDFEVVWSAGGYFDLATFRVRHWLSGEATTQVDLTPPEPLTFAPGASLLIRREVFETIGGFVEKFFLYFEDVEFSLRLSREGFGILLAPEARVWHAVQGGDGSRTTASVYYRTRNAIWLARRELKGLALRAALVSISVTGVKLALVKSRGSYRALPATIWKLLGGLWDGSRAPDPGSTLVPHKFSE